MYNPYNVCAWILKLGNCEGPAKTFCFHFLKSIEDPVVIHVCFADAVMFASMDFLVSHLNFAATQTHIIISPLPC